MALIDELKERLKDAEALCEQLTEKRRALQHDVNRIWLNADDLRTAIAALEPAPELEAPAQELPSHELLSDPGSEENAGTISEIPEGFTRWEGGECPASDSDTIDVVYRNGNHEIFTPGMITDEDTWHHNDDELDIIAYRIISQPAEQSEEDIRRIGEAEDAVDATLAGSIVDDPELKAAVERAEATLAMVDEQTCEPVDARVSWADEMGLTEPETVQPDEGGYAPVTEPEPERKAATLEDPELDAEYEAMRRRETANRKLHFSIFGHKFEDA